MNQPWVYMCSPSWTPLPPPSSSHPSGSSQCTCPVSCIEPGLVIYFTYDNMHVSMLFSHIIPFLAFSHRVQKTVIYICVSFTVSHVRLSLPYFLTTLILSRLIGEDLKIHYQIKKFTLIPSFLRAFFLLLCQCHIIQYFPSICYIYEYTIFLTVSVNKID